MIFKDEGQWTVVCGEVEDPNENAETQIKQDAQEIIVTALGDDPMWHIMNWETSKGMWSKLEIGSQHPFFTAAVFQFQGSRREWHRTY